MERDAGSHGKFHTGSPGKLTPSFGFWMTLIPLCYVRFTWSCLTNAVFLISANCNKTEYTHFLYLIMQLSHISGSNPC